MRRMIVVTGGAGFIGSNIVSRLCAEDQWDVVVCDRLETADLGKWRNIAKSAIADFWHPEELFLQLDRHAGRIAAVVHMGAISSTTEQDADLILRTNFSLSRDLWDWCVLNEARMIYASSAATYGDGEAGFEDADDLESISKLQPLNAYGYSKKLFDQYAVRSAARGHAPPQWAGLKFFNVYGPRESHKGSMRSVIHQLWPKAAQGETVMLFASDNPDYEDGGQLRDFVHVDDCVRFAIAALDADGLAGVFNVGTGKARSFRVLAVATFAAVGREPNLAYREMPEQLKGRYQYFTEARTERGVAAGLAPNYRSLEDGVGDYIAWLRDNPEF